MKDREHKIKNAIMPGMSMIDKLVLQLTMSKTKIKRSKTWRTFKGFLAQHRGTGHDGRVNEIRRGLNMMMEESYGYRLTNRAKVKFKRYIAWKDKNDVKRFETHGI